MQIWLYKFPGHYRGTEYLMGSFHINALMVVSFMDKASFIHAGLNYREEADGLPSE